MEKLVANNASHYKAPSLPLYKYWPWKLFKLQLSCELCDIARLHLEMSKRKNVTQGNGNENEENHKKHLAVELVTRDLSWKMNNYYP